MKMMDHQTEERGKLCDVVVELAKAHKPDNEKFQMLMVAYSMKRF